VKGDVAEGKVLGTNSLGGEKRSPWYDCGSWQLETFTQGFFPSRQAETTPLLSFAGAL
jgi:hypothetical protein